MSAPWERSTAKKMFGIDDVAMTGEIKVMFVFHCHVSCSTKEMFDLVWDSVLHHKCKSGKFESHNEHTRSNMLQKKQANNEFAMQMSFRFNFQQKSQQNADRRLP